MAPHQALICAGFGFRVEATPEELERAFTAALAAHALGADAVRAVSQLAFKPALLAPWAAGRGYGVLLVTREELARPELATLSRSPHVAARYPVGSIAEACALVGAQRLGAGASARLLGPRISAGSATCALAISEGRS